MSDAPLKPRHRESPPRRRWPILGSSVLTLVLVGGLLGAYHAGLLGGSDTQDQTRAGARIDSSLATHVLRPDPTRAPITTSRLRPAAPYHVVSGSVILPKPAVQLAAERAARIAAHSFTFTLGTFNVLASTHTRAGGDHPKYPPAARRSVGAVALIRSHGVDVLGTQELQPDQLNALQHATGFAAYPGYAFGAANTDNSILYNPQKFEFVSGTSFPVRFMNAVRPQTVLLLRDRASGREAYFVNTHASAITAPRYAPSNRAGHYAAAGEVNKLKATGLPVFLTGDMNGRAEFFCQVVPITGLVAAVGGNAAGGCHPAPHLAVDWVLGVGGVSWTHYWEDRSPIGHISDHFFVSAVATVSGQHTN